MKIQYKYLMTCKYYILFIMDSKKKTDIILVMKDGNIIEQGNHESLLQENGFYATLYNSQFAN